MQILLVGAAPYSRLHATELDRTSYADRPKKLMFEN